MQQKKEAMMKISFLTAMLEAFNEPAEQAEEFSPG
jgi:hypothetical protein